jgi:hypothetical protein
VVVWKYLGFYGWQLEFERQRGFGSSEFSRLGILGA